MMNQPTGRPAPEPTKLPSLIPPPQLKDAQDSSGKVRTVEAENMIVLTPDLLAKLAADQLLRGFAMSPDRSIDSMPMSIRLDGLDDGQRKAVIARLTFNRGLHAVEVKDVTYTVQVSGSSRGGLLMQLCKREQPPIDPG